MKIAPHLLQTIDWSSIIVEEHPGETGTAIWKTVNIGEIRIRMVEYSPHYQSDHWCNKGHIIQCLEGEINIISQDGHTVILAKGQTGIVGDDISPHQTSAFIGKPKINIVNHIQDYFKIVNLYQDSLTKCVNFFQDETYDYICGIQGKLKPGNPIQGMGNSTAKRLFEKY